MRIGAAQRASFLEVTASDPWHPAMAVCRTPIGFADIAIPWFLTGPTFGTRATTGVCGSSGKSVRLHRRMGFTCFDFWMTRDTSSSLFPPARYTTSARAVRGSWCLQTHLTGAFARGIQRNVDDSRGAAVASCVSHLDCTRFAVYLRADCLSFWGGSYHFDNLRVSGSGFFYWV